jgi:hypothetical protein
MLVTCTQYMLIQVTHEGREGQAICLFCGPLSRKLTARECVAFPDVVTPLRAPPHGCQLEASSQSVAGREWRPPTFACSHGPSCQPFQCRDAHELTGASLALAVAAETFETSAILRWLQVTLQSDPGNVLRAFKPFECEGTPGNVLDSFKACQKALQVPKCW